jgi:hypothetical protein
MKDLVIELILIATIVVPLVADALQPARAVSRNRSGLFRRLRRSH